MNTMLALLKSAPLSVGWFSGFTDWLRSWFGSHRHHAAAVMQDPNGIVPQIPEPSTLAMLAVGVFLVALVVRRKRSHGKLH